MPSPPGWPVRPRTVLHPLLDGASRSARCGHQNRMQSARKVVGITQSLNHSPSLPSKGVTHYNFSEKVKQHKESAAAPWSNLLDTTRQRSLPHCGLGASWEDIQGQKSKMQSYIKKCTFSTISKQSSIRRKTSIKYTFQMYV